MKEGRGGGNWMEGGAVARDKNMLGQEGGEGGEVAGDKNCEAGEGGGELQATVIYEGAGGRRWAGGGGRLPELQEMWGGREEFANNILFTRLLIVGVSFFRVLAAWLRLLCMYAHSICQEK